MIHTSINPPNNKVSVGESFFIKDNENWYQIVQLHLEKFKFRFFK